MSQIRIAVCDDQRDVLDSLCKTIKAIRDQENENWIISPFIHVTELLQKVNTVTVVFLDLSMPEMDGIEAAKRIHSINSNCSIVIATGEHHRYKEAFKVKAFRFVSKPFIKEEIREALLAAIIETPGNETIQVSKSRVLFDIRQIDILYVRSINSYVEIVTIDNDVYRKPITLSEMERILNPRLFVRTHRSYIANMKWITSLKPTKVTLRGKDLPVSARLYTSVMKKHASFQLDFRL